MLVHVVFSTKHQEPRITEEIEALWRWRERRRRACRSRLNADIRLIPATNTELGEERALVFAQQRGSASVHRRDSRSDRPRRDFRRSVV